jgi:hypothetical protein
MQPTNPKLENLVQQWRKDGEPAQEAFPWRISKAKWCQLADDFSVEIANFPELIDRKFLWNLSASSAPAESVFLAVMIWGYGDIGYGPHRVRQMYESEGFSEKIRTVKNLCEVNESLEAYKFLKGSRIRQLGPSFGSKVLTFFHTPSTAPPILDSIVATWINENAPDLIFRNGVNAETWNLPTYERYIKWMMDLANELDAPVCSLEQLIFSDGYYA